jgi:hypothetical protein
MEVARIRGMTRGYIAQSETTIEADRPLDSGFDVRSPMSTEQEPTTTALVTKSARPFTGFLLGLILGIALAVIIQQAGIWPLDQLLLFGAAGLFALIGMLIGGAGRDKAGPFASILPLVLAVALLAFGALGFASFNQNGEINGGCTVDATSSVDATVVTDSSRQDPFEIDPNGSLSWVAASPGPITDHLWNIYVDVGGFSIPIAGNEEPEPNSAGTQENIGDVADVSSYVQEVSDIAGFELRGVLEVGGDIEGGGGACDGFGFVVLTADPLSTLVSRIAAVIAALALISLLLLVFNRTREAEVVIADEAGASHPYAEAGDAGSAGAVAGRTLGTARGTGAHERRDPPVDDNETAEPDPDAGGDDDM